MPADIATLFLEDAKARFHSLKVQAEKSFVQVPDSDWRHQLSPESNSIANLVKHVAGNIRSRFTNFLTTDGEKPDRNRDSEFELFDADTAENLRGRWEASWKILFSELEKLAPADLALEVRIRGESHSVVDALNRAIAHYAVHVGQILMLAKYQTGDEWRTLSIPKGGSQAFFDRMQRGEGTSWRKGAAEPGS